MRSIELLEASDARRIDTMVFDLDDTMLDRGQLGEQAYAALFRMNDAGIELMACTGRPAGWAEIYARQWPVTAALAENGAVAWTKDRQGRVALIDTVEASERKRRREALDSAALALRRAHPALTLADDNASRRTDMTFDIGEHTRVDEPTVEAVRCAARALGLRTFVSSVHLHITFETHDKASGFASLCSARGRDPVRALGRAAYVGDSANDGPAFAAFGLTFGVSNVRAHLGKMTVPPRFVAADPGGLGFAGICRRIVELRQTSL